MKKFTPIIKEMKKRAIDSFKKPKSVDKCEGNCERILETLLSHSSIESLELLVADRHGGNKGLLSDLRKLKTIADERKGER